MGCEMFKLKIKLFIRVNNRKIVKKSFSATFNK